MTIIRILIVFLGVAFLCLPAASQTIEIKLKNETVQGRVIGPTDAGVQLLARDGQMLQIDSKDVLKTRKITNVFRGYSSGEMRPALIREFGNKYQVTGTRHYLVVHPKGQSKVWAERFEQLFLSMKLYYSVRGFRPQEPKFPLVAIVFPTQSHFMDYARNDGFAGVSRNVLGYYSHQTNRIAMFDNTGGGDKKSKNWAANAGTLIHEAAHQTAFNTGLHTRYSVTPKWVVEGVGTMFEAPGVWNSRNYPQLKHRINFGRLENYRRLVAPNALKTMERLISSDRYFSANSAEAYATAWTLTLFFTENHPQQYWKYLAKISKRQPGQPYTSQQRMKDFTDAFGKNLVLLDARVQRFVKTLPAT